jgi:hypothetical protein
MTDLEPSEMPPDLPRCPGCLRTTGPPGALCPYCGSRYPDPAAGATATVLWVIAAAGIGLAVLLSGLSETVAGIVGLIGVIALFGAISSGSQARGRVGPASQRQVSCCGCSCVVGLVAIPSLGALLWAHGGPALAAVALPGWIPLSWVIRGCECTAACVAKRCRLGRRSVEGR